MKSYIRGIGRYLPEKVLTNADLEKIMDTSDEWIYTRTGMRERRIAGEEESTSHMGAQAATQAILDANLEVGDIDLIICATLSPDHLCPSTACYIQKKIGAKGIGAFDLGAACTGFIYALSTAKSFVESGVYKNVLVIASERLSRIVDYEDRTTAILFGDGAGAVVVSDQPKKGLNLSISECSLGADGELSELLHIPAGGTNSPCTEKTLQDREHYIRMNGREVFKNAVRNMEAIAFDVIKKNGLTLENIDYLVPHQANKRIIDAIATRCQIPEEKVVLTIDRFANTSASSVVICLFELWFSGRLEDGENLLMVAFGAGLTWGSALLSVEIHGG